MGTKAGRVRGLGNLAFAQALSAERQRLRARSLDCSVRSYATFVALFMLILNGSGR